MISRLLELIQINHEKIKIAIVFKLKQDFLCSALKIQLNYPLFTPFPLNFNIKYEVKVTQKQSVEVQLTLTINLVQLTFDIS